MHRDYLTEFLTVMMFLQSFFLTAEKNNMNEFCEDAWENQTICCLLEKSYLHCIKYSPLLYTNMPISLTLLGIYCFPLYPNRPVVAAEIVKITCFHTKEKISLHDTLINIPACYLCSTTRSSFIIWKLFKRFSQHLIILVI